MDTQILNKFVIKVFCLTWLLASCSPPTNNAKSNDKSNNDKIKNDEMGNDVPPFKVECNCDFKEFGRYKISDNNYNVYFSGKGWNPNIEECSFIWGEIVSNIVPDTNITFLKIHLLDLNVFDLPTNLTDYGNDSLKNFVIAVYYFDKNVAGDKCIFDPFRTGKYHIPKGWRDN